MAALYDLMFLNTETDIKVQADATDTIIDVDSTTGMAAEQAVTIALDDASVHLSIITSVTDADTIVIRDGIPAGRHADVDATVKSYYGYMCRKLPDSREKDFRVEDSPLLPEILITGEATYANISPEKEIRLIANDWRKGIQELMLSDTYKYFDAENCDMRFKGLGILSHKKLSAISFGSVPTAPTLVDGGLEAWDDADTLTHWTRTGDVAHRDTSPVHGGTYSARGGGTYSEEGTLHQDVWSEGNLPAGCKGKRFKVSVWGYTTAHSDTRVQIQISDGVGTSSSGWINDASDTWQQGTVERILDASATKLTITLDWEADGGDYVNMDDVVIECYPIYSGGVVDQVAFGASEVVAMGNCLFTIETGSAVFEYNFPEIITDLCVYTPDSDYIPRLFIAQGWSDEYFYTSDLSTFTECTLSDSTAKHMADVATDTGRGLLISDSNSTLRISADPINGGDAFSTQYQVGDDNWDITGLVDHNATWFVRKEDDIYYLSGSDVVSLLNLGTEASTVYLHSLYCWGDYLFIPSGLNSLYLYEVSTGTALVVSPTRYAIGDTNYDGQILSMCFDETYAYAAVLNGSNIRILSGRFENVEGDTDWWWHPIYSQTMNDVASMLISNLSGNKRMYVGTDTYTDGIIPFKVSVSYSAVYLETDFECETSGDIITSWIQTNFPTDSKAWTSVDVTSICKSSNATSITVYYQKKGDSGWTSLGSCTQSSGAGYPAEVTDTFEIGVSSERIRFKFSLATTDDDYTPILYGLGGGVVVHAVLQTDRKLQIVAMLNIESNITIRDRTVRTRSIATDLANLKALYRAGEQETVTTPDEDEYDVTFDREGFIQQLAYDEAGQHNEIWWVTVKLLEA